MFASLESNLKSMFLIILQLWWIHYINSNWFVFMAIYFFKGWILANLMLCVWIYDNMSNVSSNGDLSIKTIQMNNTEASDGKETSFQDLWIVSTFSASIVSMLFLSLAFNCHQRFWGQVVTIKYCDWKDQNFISKPWWFYVKQECPLHSSAGILLKHHPSWQRRCPFSAGWFIEGSIHSTANR